jgi:hypothetical protein
MAPRKAIEGQVKMLESHGVHTDRLVWAPSAILAVYRLAAGDDAAFAAVDVSEDGSVIACFDGPRLRGLRVLQPSDRDTLVRNLVWSLRTLDPPERVIVGGSLAMDLSGPLAESLSGFAVEQLPFDCPVTLAEGASTGWRACVAPLGLVLAATGEISTPLIEFSLDSASNLEPSQARQAVAQILPWAAAAAAGLVFAAAFDYANLRRQASRLEERAQLLARPVLPGGTTGPGLLTKLGMRAAELEKRQGEGQGSGAEISPLGVLAIMSSSVPRELEIEFDTYVYEPPGVRLRGQGASFETVTLLQQALQANERFREVAVSDVRAAVGGEGVVFEVRLQLGGSPGNA